MGRLLDDDALQRVRRAMDQEALVESVKNPYGVLRHNPWTRHADLADVLLDPALGRRIAQFVGTDCVVLFQDVLVSKPPGTVDRVEWHQDYAYWPLNAPRGLTLWIAIDDAEVDNGCLHYVPGSHLLGEHAPTDFVLGAAQLEKPELPALSVDEAMAVAAPICAGEALVHHPLTWHMSPPNRSTRPRRAWSISWIHPDVRWDPAHAPHPFNHELEPVAGDTLSGPIFPKVGI